MTAQGYNFRARLKIASILTFDRLPPTLKHKLEIEYAERISKKLSQDFWRFYDNFQPDKVLILSASPNIYVKRIGEKLSFDAVGSEIIHGVYKLMAGSNKRLFANHYLNHLGEENSIILALGNSLDDIPFMELGDMAFLIYWGERVKSKSFNGIRKVSWSELSDLNTI